MPFSFSAYLVPAFAAVPMPLSGAAICRVALLHVGAEGAQPSSDGSSSWKPVILIHTRSSISTSPAWMLVSSEPGLAEMEELHLLRFARFIQWNTCRQSARGC